jgi:hypothetical protein
LFVAHAILSSAYQRLKKAPWLARAHLDRQREPRDPSLAVRQTTTDRLRPLRLRPLGHDGQRPYIRCLVAVYAFLDVQQSNLHRDNEPAERVKQFSMIEHLGAQRAREMPMLIARAIRENANITVMNHLTRPRCSRAAALNLAAQARAGHNGFSQESVLKPKKKAAKSKSTARSRAATARKPAAGQSTVRLRDLADWRQETLARIRALILAADPEMTEEQKWRKPSNPAGVPVWSHHGMVCTGESYKNAVKLTFAHGASLPDPKGLFNAGLEGNMRRAIDIAEGATVDPGAFKALIKAAVARNLSAAKK